MTKVKISLIAAVLTAAATLFTCEKVPDFCGTGALYDPSCQFCFGGEAFNKCGGKEYNPLTQGCIQDATVGTRCLDGSAVPAGTPCGGYTLAIAAAPEIGGVVKYTAPDAGPPYAFGGQVILSAIANEEFKFDGWAGAQPTGGEVATYSMKGGSAHITIAAVFKPVGKGKLITEAFPKDGGTVSRSPNKDNYSDEKVTVAATPATGYTFVGWSGADTSKNPTTTVFIDESKTLVAMFSPVAHTLSVNVSPAYAGAVFVNGSALAGASSQNFGSRVAVWAVAEKGFSFKNWSSETKKAKFDNANSVNTTVTLDSTATITANFVSAKGGGTAATPSMICTLTVATGEGGNVSLDPEGTAYPNKPKTSKRLSATDLKSDLSSGQSRFGYMIGTQVTVRATPNLGYAFTGWSGASGSKNAVVTIMMDGNRTLTANFDEQTVKLYVVTISSVSMDPTGGGSYTEGEKVGISAGTAPTGYKFKNWTAANDDVTFANANRTSTSFTMPANAVTITANFELLSGGEPSNPLYVATISSAGTGATGGGGYTEGATVSITAGTAPDGQQFKNWTSSDGVKFADANKTATTFAMPAKAVTVTANFETIKYTVTLLTTDSYATGGGSYAAGSPVTVTAGTAPNGRRFKNWTSEDGVTFGDANNSTTTFIMPANPVRVTAVFEPVYTATVLSAGTGASSGGSYAAGETVSISAGIAPSGQQFKNWTSADGVTFTNTNSAATTFIMPGNAVTVTAVFDGIKYAVTVSSAGTGATGGGSYTAGATVSISAGTAPSGQQFKNWTSADGVTFGNANSVTTTFTMPSKAVTVTAAFEAIPIQTYTVTVSSAGTGATGGGNYAAGATVSISAGTAPSGQQFKNWTSSDGVTFGNANNATTTFTMPSKAVTVTAVFGGTFIDNRDSKIYRIVSIGEQTWMAENLNYQTLSGSWCYLNSTDSCNKYGRLYDWNTVMAGATSSTANPSGVKGVCPSGWHLPSDKEWDNLVTAAGGSSVAGSKLKSSSGWNYSSAISSSSTDEFGFSALPGGIRYSDGRFDDAGDNGYWWTATEDSDDNAYNLLMYYYYDYVFEFNYYKSNGFSARCVQDK